MLSLLVHLHGGIKLRSKCGKINNTKDIFGVIKKSTLTISLKFHGFYFKENPGKT